MQLDTCMFPLLCPLLPHCRFWDSVLGCVTHVFEDLERVADLKFPSHATAQLLTRRNNVMTMNFTQNK